MRLKGMIAWHTTRVEAARTFAARAQRFEGPAEAPGSEGLVSDAPALRAQLQCLVRAARAAGLVSLSSVVLRLAEWLEPCLRAGQIGLRERALARHVGVQCCRYLEDPANVQAAADMVAALANGSMSAAHRAERAQLLQGALEEGTYLLAGAGCEAYRRLLTARAPDAPWLQVSQRRHRGEAGAA
jgi:hypothetical protein